jgi:DNA-binding NarL/FixJ family response regulator
MSRTVTALRPQPTARRPFAALVVSPHESRRNAIVGVLERSGARRVVQCPTGEDARDRARIDTRNDVCVLDGSLSDVPLLVLVRNLEALGWRRIMLLSARHDLLGIKAAILTGVRGYVVTEGNWSDGSPRPSATAHLTAREIEVLQSVANGMSNKDIGAYLGLSSLTVKSHMARIARKLGTGDRAQLVALGMRDGIID